MRGAAVRIALAAGALVLGLVVDAAAGDPASDALTPRLDRTDSRVVVVAFEAGRDGLVVREAAYRRATFYRDIANVAQNAGARAIGFVDFDSLGFSDGAGGRGNVVGSSALAEAGVIPLIDVTVESASEGLPLLTAYRVDPLSSELAGTAMPLAARGDVVRTVPALARAIELADGAIVNLAPFAVEAADRDATSVVPGLAFRLAELGTGTALTEPAVDGVTLGDRRVPLEDGSLRVRWSSELDSVDDVRVIAFTDVIKGLGSDSVFQDAIVLVGTVDPASTAFVDTPIGRLPELLVHANALNTVLTGETIAEGSWVPSTLAAAVAALLIVALAIWRRWLAWLVALAVGASWLVLVWFLAGDGTLLRPLAVPVAAVVAALLATLLSQLTALAERRHLRSLFSQYVPATVAQQLVASGRGAAASEGERVVVTALFCDLRGFTSLAAVLEPGQVRDLLNRYYDAMAKVVLECEGTVLQYTGDEVFAVFGAPLPMVSHADVALRCARRMFAVLPDLNTLLSDETLPHLNFGIGVHSGDVIAAHVGSSIRMQYTVIGDAINIASRHCSMARAGQVMLSSVTYALLSDQPDDAERVEDIPIKGIAGRHVAYRVQCIPDLADEDPDGTVLAGVTRIDPQP
ncbi:MAG: adenylate/guanylate cyclase domain-containing protein [Ilumatobacteraceae bacterium]